MPTKSKLDTLSAELADTLKKLSSNKITPREANHVARKAQQALKKMKAKSAKRA